VNSGLSKSEKTDDRHKIGDWGEKEGYLKKTIQQRRSKRIVSESFKEEGKSPDSTCQALQGEKRPSYLRESSDWAHKSNKE